MLRYLPPSFVVSSWGDEEIAPVVYKYIHRNTYIMQSMDPKCSQSDKRMWTIHITTHIRYRYYTQFIIYSS